MITIIDYGMGNLGSIANMFKKIGVDAVVTSDIDVIEQAKKIILPGVGAFGLAMQNLKKLSMLPVLYHKVIHQRTPLLGICLGMQLLTHSSEEGNLPGLGWIDAETKRFNFTVIQAKQKLRIPHMGWNTIHIVRGHPLFSDMFPENRFYFVHSFHVVCHNPGDVLTTTFYGYDFASSVAKDNIFGVQFHPEKSHKFGMRVLKNFVENVPC